MQSVVVNSAIEIKPTLTYKLHLNVILNDNDTIASVVIQQQQQQEWNYSSGFSSTSLCSHNVAYIKSALACCKVNYVELSDTITFDEVSVLRGQY